MQLEAAGLGERAAKAGVSANQRMSAGAPPAEAPRRPRRPAGRGAAAASRSTSPSKSRSATARASRRGAPLRRRRRRERAAAGERRVKLRSVRKPDGTSIFTHYAAAGGRDS